MSGTGALGRAPQVALGGTRTSAHGSCSALPYSNLQRKGLQRHWSSSCRHGMHDMRCKETFRV